MNEVYDNEDMIGMERKKHRHKGSGQINESDAEFDFTTEGNARFRILVVCVYPRMDLRYFRARRGIEPRGRCFMHHHSSGAFLTSSPDRTNPTSTDLQPPPPELYTSQLPCDITHPGLHR